MVPDSDSIPPLEHCNSSCKGLLAIALPFAYLPLQRREARTPSNWQSPPQLILELVDLLVELFATLGAPHRYCIHGRGEEEPDRFVDVGFCCDGGEGELGE